MRTIKIQAIVDMPIPELRGSLSNIKFPAFGEIKYDGEFTFIVYANGKICTINKYNRIRTDFPALNKIKDSLKCKSAVMLAELFYGDGRRNALYNLNSNKESDSLNLSVFDIFEQDGVNLASESLLDRKEILHKALPSCIHSRVLNNKADAELYFKWTVDCGYEGAVIKSMDSRLIKGPCSWVKMKMKDRTDYPVSFVDSDKERIEVAVPDPIHGILSPVTVGVKAALRYKRHINVGDQVTIEHQGVLPSGSLRHPVLIPKKEWR